MSDGFVLAHDLAANLIAESYQIWQQVLPDTGKACEPVESAWQRFFCQPMPSVPLLFSMIETPDGCHAVVRLYERGRFVCIQGGFASIRVLNRRAKEIAGNIADRLESYDPMSAYKHTLGIADTTDADYGFEPDESEWFEWAASLPPVEKKVSVSAEEHHAKVAGATQLFLGK